MAGKRSKCPGHCLTIVCHQNSLETGRNFQYFEVTLAREFRLLRSLEIHKGFSAQDAVHDSAVKVHVCRELDPHFLWECRLRRASSNFWYSSGCFLRASRRSFSKSLSASSRYSSISARFAR